LHDSANHLKEDANILAAFNGFISDVNLDEFALNFSFVAITRKEIVQSH
jgi:hypothetical protein